MIQFLVAYFAGMLTVAAPCVLPLLPIVIGGSAISSDKSKSKNNWIHPLVITLSLATSVFIFSLLLKASTTLIGVPQIFWSILSGVIVILFGLNLLFPIMWEKIVLLTKFNIFANQTLGKNLQKNGIIKDIGIGAALGPVFSSCSPTYALIVAIILPVSFLQGAIYLFGYVLGLATILFALAFAGQSIVQKLNWLSNPNSVFKKVIGVLFITVGILVIFGIDKDIQTFVLDNGWYDPIMKIEQKLGF